MNITDLGEREPNFNGLLSPLTPVYISTKFLSEFIQNLCLQTECLTCENYQKYNHLSRGSNNLGLA